MPQDIGAKPSSSSTPASTRSDARALVDLQRTLYDSRNPTRRWLHRERLGRISAAVTEVARSRSGKAIEVGPGAGPYVGLLCDLFDRVVATDIEDAYLDYVRDVHGDRPNLELRADDIAASSLDAADFDLVLCSEVIEHTPDPAAVLAGLSRLLRPGGILVLSTPQPWSTVELLGRVAFWPGVIQLVRAIYREPVLPTGHISLISRNDLEAMIRANGLDVRSSSLSGLYLPLLAEAGGQRAVRIEESLAERLSTGPLAGLLWTQYWIAGKPA